MTRSLHAEENVYIEGASRRLRRPFFDTAPLLYIFTSGEERMQCCAPKSDHRASNEYLATMSNDTRPESESTVTFESTTITTELFGSDGLEDLLAAEETRVETTTLVSDNQAIIKSTAQHSFGKAPDDDEDGRGEEGKNVAGVVRDSKGRPIKTAPK
ncbi:hypothetical protein D9611_010193 [Ephemerocybe angulata]|uniref:Uncharacterized protein n=1 Tax=Ephemerocybe angulata TaxID=980116 RepID=A0A8H5AZ62_9AGAR|nr:hypothetical protein D9611_010193 [Tulosesus angulatus]